MKPCLLEGSQLERSNMDNEFAAYVAIDWADQKHVWALEAADSASRQSGTLEHTPEAIDVWAAELQLRFAGQPVAIALEQSRGPLVFMLSKYQHLVLFPVHPTSLANYRKIFRPSGAKDDPHDAGLLLDILTRHRDKLRRLNPDTVERRTLQFLVEERRKLVHEKTRYSNRITAHLKMYFPQVLQWFDDIGSVLAIDFLQRWPDLETLQRTRTTTLERFFLDHNSRSMPRIRQRIEEMRKAVRAVHDEAVISSCRAAVAAWTGVLRPILQSIQEYDQRIDSLARQHPDYAVMNSFPGAGPVLTPRLMVALGSQRDRYQTAHEVQCYSGIAPVIASSGQQRWVHWRWVCPKFLRQTFHERALHSIGHSQWAREYYQQQRAKGKSRHTAIRALAFKWVRILFRCWKDRKTYDELAYQRALAARRPKPTPPETVELQWKNVAGFNKIAIAQA
jgi:transposase